MQELNYEAVVIGAGIAGLSTALRLSELKIRTAVLEKGVDDGYPCNTRIAGVLSTLPTGTWTTRPKSYSKPSINGRGAPRTRSSSRPLPATSTERRHG